MKIGHYGTPSLVAFLTALVLLVIQFAVPFGIVDHPADQNRAGLDDDTVSVADIAADFDTGSRYNLPNPDIAFSGILIALVAGTLLLIFGLMPMGVNVARYTGWGLALVGATGAWMALASTAYWIGTGFTTLLGVLSSNPHETDRLWIISPLLIAGGALFMLRVFLRVATGVISTRDGLRDAAKQHTRTITLAAIILVAMLAVPWSFQILDGDERRDNNECNQSAVCEGRLDWYSAWGASAGANLAILQVDLEGDGFGSDANGLYGGILTIAPTSDTVGVPLFAHASFSLKVLTAAAWTTFFAGFIATLGGVITSATNRDAKAFVLAHAAGLIFVAWAAVQFVLLAAYQWRPSYDNNIIPDAQSWWFAFVPLAAAPLLVALAVRQIHLVRPLFVGVTRVAKEKAQTAHSFD